MTDWPALLPDVARRLLGDPQRHDSDTWRYGTHGSMAVHVGGDRRGTWRDFEADTGGGTLALVEHVNDFDKAGALRWLADAGLIAPDSRVNGATAAPRRPTGNRTPPDFAGRADGAGTPKPSKTAPLAAAILAASVPADDTPARR